MKNIILDTNMLLVPEKFKVDIFTEINRIYTAKCKIHVVKQTIEELEKLSEKSKYKDKVAAKVGLQLIKAKDLKILSQKEGYTDDVLVSFGKEGYIIATQDAGLKKRLKELHLEHVTLRQEKYLIIINKQTGN